MSKEADKDSLVKASKPSNLAKDSHQEIKSPGDIKINTNET